MTPEELIELLAEKEHEDRTGWLNWLFSKCEMLHNGMEAISADLADNLKTNKSIQYRALSEQEKQLCREEVARILPIIEEYVKSPLQEKKLKNHVEAIEHRLEGVKQTVRILEDQLSSLLREPDMQFYMKKLDLARKSRSPLHGESSS